MVGSMVLSMSIFGGVSMGAGTSVIGTNLILILGSVASFICLRNRK